MRTSTRFGLVVREEVSFTPSEYVRATGIEEIDKPSRDVGTAVNGLRRGVVRGSVEAKES